MRLLVLFLFLLGPTAAMGGSLFKCKGPDGGLIFSDSPCPENAEQLEHTRVEPEPVEPVELPEEASADANAPPLPAGAGENAAYLYAAQFTQALSSLAPVRISVEAYYSQHGAWPKQVGDLGLDKKTLRSKQIEGVEMRRSGVIRARLNPDVFGERRRIELSPKLVMSGMQVEWSCKANIPPHLLSVQGFALCVSKGFK